ncbi:MAG: SprT family zinc-dependent metalloprotease [Clostridium sp.]|uniref:M48 family metallopeptidase n=1 Tax=Clostridium sp. TaxID=1506 RepID=UPI002FC5D8A1
MKPIITYKKVKNITLRIKADGTVNLTVPFGVSKEAALRFLSSKEKWVEEKLKNISSAKVNINSKFNTGDRLLYLGEEYTLDVYRGKSSVNIEGKNIVMYVDNVDDYELKKQTIHKWYLDRAREIFLEYINKWENKTGLKVNKVTIRPMKTRWGSCNHRLHKINLNLEMIRRSRDFIDYVVLHEVAHIKHNNHSKEFWDFVKLYMPNYKSIKTPSV